MRKYFLLAAVIAITATKSSSQVISRQEMITDFFQTIVEKDEQMAKCLDDEVWGNCVVIALIKTALVEFGSVNNVYSSYRNTGDEIFITFNDGLQVTLTKEELKEAEQSAKFGREAGSKYFNDAIIVYASICKRVQVHKTGVIEKYKKCVNTFRDGILFINSGFPTDNCGVLLGLKLVERKAGEQSSLNAAIIRTAAHTAYCSEGVQDINGNRHVIVNNKMKNPRGPSKRIKKVFTLAK